MYIFERINPTEEIWQDIESSYDSTVFHAKQFSDFIVSKKHRIIVVEVKENDALIGHFVGMRMWFGISMLCSPMEGFGYTQGLCFKQPVPDEKRIEIYKELAKWVFKKHLASYIQIDDWQLKKVFEEKQLGELRYELLDQKQISYTVRGTLFLDLRKSEEELWENLHYKSCKYCVNKANKLGLRFKVVERFEDIEAFTKVHYSQLVDVCDRHGITPKSSQSQSRMKALCESLFPNRVLMCEVVGPDDNGTEQVMSSGIFCYDKGECTYWTGASYRQYMKFCPNELMVWEAIRYLHNHGAGELNFGGVGTYKLKFGVKYAYVPKMYFYRFEFFYKAKIFAFRMYHRIRDLRTRK